MMDIEFQRHISLLVFRYLEGKLAPQEQRELEKWRTASDRHEEMFQELIKTSRFETNYRHFVKNEKATQAEWAKIQQRTFGKGRSLWKRNWHYAALWLLPFLLGGGIFYLLNHANTETGPILSAFVPGASQAVLELPDGTYVDLKKAIGDSKKEGINWRIAEDSLKYHTPEKLAQVQYHTLRIPRGGEYTLILADGSKVFLNAESSLRYPIGFVGDSRRVKLEGEAYFQISRDTCCPFIVEVNDMQIKVLGTSFGVRAYSEERGVLTTLVSGKVSVLSAGKEYTLKPEEQAVYDKASKEVKITSVDTELFVGWKDGRLIFDNCPLERILKDLGRWYSFDVFYANQTVKDIPFSLNIKKHEKFYQVLQLLENTRKMKFEINKNTVIVR